MAVVSTRKELQLRNQHRVCLSSTTHLTLQTSSKSHKVWSTRIQIFTLSIRKMNPMGQSAPPTENKNSCLPVPTYWRMIFKFLSCQNRVVNLQTSACRRKKLCCKNSLLWVISWKHTLFILQLLKDEAANSSPLKFSAAKLCLSSRAGSRHCDKWMLSVHSVSGSSSCWMMHC